MLSAHDVLLKLRVLIPYDKITFTTPSQLMLPCAYHLAAPAASHVPHMRRLYQQARHMEPLLRAAKTLTPDIHTSCAQGESTGGAMPSRLRIASWRAAITSEGSSLACAPRPRSGYSWAQLTGNFSCDTCSERSEQSLHAI